MNQTKRLKYTPETNPSQEGGDWRLTLPDAFRNFLNPFPWEYYLTLTFKEETHPEQADRVFRRYMRFLSLESWGRRFREKGKRVYWSRGLEFQKRGVLHFHALIFGGVQVPFQVMHHLWGETSPNAGFSWIERFNPLRGAVGYLGKYISKGGEIDCFLPRVNKQETLWRV